MRCVRDPQCLCRAPRGLPLGPPTSHQLADLEPVFCNSGGTSEYLTQSAMMRYVSLSSRGPARRKGAVSRRSRTELTTCPARPPPSSSSLASPHSSCCSNGRPLTLSCLVPSSLSLLPRLPPTFARSQHLSGLHCYADDRTSVVAAHHFCSCQSKGEDGVAKLRCVALFVLAHLLLVGILTEHGADERRRPTQAVRHLRQRQARRAPDRDRVRRVRSGASPPLLESVMPCSSMLTLSLVLDVAALQVIARGGEEVLALA